VVRLGSHRRGRVQEDQDRVCLVAARHNAPLSISMLVSKSNSGNRLSIHVTLTIVGTIAKDPCPSFLSSDLTILRKRR